MDLYDRARDYPASLRGSLTVATFRQLTESAITPDALQWRAEHGVLRRPHRGAYLCGSESPDLLDRIRAALVVCPPETVIGHATAAALHGFGVVPSGDVHVLTPAGVAFPQRPGIRVHQSVLPVVPITLFGVPCVPAARCVADLARTLGRPDAVAVLDAALRTGVCSPDEIATELTLHAGLRGFRRAGELIAWADPRPQCRQESHLRLLVIDAGLIGFEPQMPVSDGDGYVRYYIDLGNRTTRVGAEYDGTSHLDRERLRADRDRHNWLASRGWAMRYFTDQDIYQRPSYVVATLRLAQSRAHPYRSTMRP